MELFTAVAMNLHLGSSDDDGYPPLNLKRCWILAAFESTLDQTDDNVGLTHGHKVFYKDV